MAPLAKMIISAALVMFALRGCLGTAEDYDRRPPVAKIGDGLYIQQKVMQHKLTSQNLALDILDTVKSLIDLQIIREENIGERTLAGSQGAIMTAIMEDFCDWLKEKQVVASDSTCPLAEMKVIQVKINIFNTSVKTYNQPIVRQNPGVGHVYCFCAWARYQVLDDNCTSPYYSDLIAAQGISPCTTTRTDRLCDPGVNVSICSP